MRMLVNEIMSIREKNFLHFVPVDILLRMLRVLDHQIHRAEGLSINECEHICQLVIVPNLLCLREIFATGDVLRAYLTMMTVIFFWVAHDSDFFSDKFGVRSIRESPYELTTALYLQVSIVSQALIFVTRSRSWSFVERPGLLLLTAFVIAQLVSYYGKFNCISSSCFCKLITYSVMKFNFIINHKDTVMLR